MSASIPTIDYALLAAVVLMLVHALGPRIRSVMRSHASAVASFGGGLAVAYVFLQLLPEIELAHQWLEANVHAVTLASFLAFFVFETYLLRRYITLFHRHKPSNRASTVVVDDNRYANRLFWTHIGLSWMYTWMVMFALPRDHAENVWLAIVGSVAVGLHLIYKDYVLRVNYGTRYEAKGRYLLAIAPFFGWLAHWIVKPPEHVFDLFIAVLAGVLMQGVFQDEMPRRDTARLRWLIAGAGTFTLLVFLAG